MDHRDLNRDLDLFASDPLAGAGLPLWLPHGTAIREELERLAAELARADGCVEVRTPVLGKRALFEHSGHWAKFADDMFPPMPVGGDELVLLRPAQLPAPSALYPLTRAVSRDPPLLARAADPPARDRHMFRAERSGVLSGLQRVRQIALDDTHVFCRPDQVAQEAARGLRSALPGAGDSRPAHRSGPPEPARRRRRLPRPADRLGRRGGSAAGGWRGGRSRPGRRARRGRLLRPQARPPGRRGHHRDRATRLPAAGTLRPHLRRRRRLPGRGR